MWKPLRLAILVLLTTSGLLAAGSVPRSALADTSYVQLSSAIGQTPDGYAEGASLNYTYYDQSRTVNYSGGSEVISTCSDGSCSNWTDDVAVVTVTAPGGSTCTWTLNSYTNTYPAADISYCFSASGSYSVRLQLVDKIGPYYSAPDFYIVNSTSGTTGCIPTSYTFPQFPSHTQFSVNTGLVTTSLGYSFGLTGATCPSAPVTVSVGSDPSVTIHSDSGDTKVSISGELESPLSITRGDNHYHVSFSAFDRTLNVSREQTSSVQSDDFSLSSDRTATLGQRINPDPTQLAYLMAVSVAIAAALAEAAVTAPAAALAPALNDMLFLYSGPSVTPIQLAPVTSTPALTAPSTTSGVTPSVSAGTLADLQSVFGADLINASSVAGLTLNGGTRGPGQNVTFSGSGFTPGGLVYVSLSSPDASTILAQSQVRASSTGAISGQFTLPNNVAPGRQLVTAFDATQAYNQLQSLANGTSTSVNFHLAANTFNIPVYQWVPIDIMPGDTTSSINPYSTGSTPVAVLSTGGFDATHVDLSSLQFGPNSVAPTKGAFEDANQDGRRDLVAQFPTKQSGILMGATQACLFGQTTYGQYIAGCDAITTSPKGK